MSPMSPRLLRPRQTGFSPKDVATLAVWLDFADSSTLFQNDNGTTAATAAGDPVGYVADKSGAGRNATQSTGNNRPAVSSGTQNGLRGLTFDNDNDLLSLGNLSGVFTSEATAFVVFALAAQDTFYSLLNTGVGFAHTMFFDSVPKSFEGSWRTARINGLTSVLPLSNLDARIYSIEASSSYVTRVNGVVDVSTSNTYSVGSTYQIGGHSTSGYLNGTIYEVLLYSSVLSESNRKAVEAYLTKRWGIV